jgi:D-sedoheptulose 7-phosphate isomerase
MSMLEEIIREINDSVEAKSRLKGQATHILEAADMIAAAMKSGGKVVFFGNGGSAADAQHISAEFVGKFYLKRRALASIAFTTNTSILTAVANDFGYEEVFRRQVESLVQPADVVVGISTSGLSENVIRGLMEAKKIGAKTIGLTGGNGGEFASLVDLVLKVQSENTQRIQECHILVGHILCGIVEKELQHQEDNSRNWHGYSQQSS